MKKARAPRPGCQHTVHRQRPGETAKDFLARVEAERVAETRASYAETKAKRAARAKGDDA